MQTPRSAFNQGLRDQTPFILGNIPFGMITGAAAVSAGADPWLAIGMSVIMFSGAAQLAAISLLAQHAPAAIVVLTVLVVNLRMMMYSAAVAPFFAKTPTPRKWLFSYLLTDHAFALLTTKFDKQHVPKHIDAYYFGVTGAMWLSWHASIVIGVFAGTMVPARWSLDFAIPLVFLSLVLPALQTRSHWNAAIAATIAAAFCTSLPLKLGLIAAAATGIIVGVVSERISHARATAISGRGA
ncbi:MAG: AzlC family ABC transporter permease [Betaproteobacteria bacterium]